MKCVVIVVLFFISLVYGAKGARNKSLSGVVHNKLEEDLLTFFGMWLKGDVQNFSLPLPALNVITVPKLQGTYKEFGIRILYSTSEMKLTGLPNAYVDELVATQTDTSYTILGMLVAPSLMLTAEKYKLDGSAYLFYSIKGSGKMRVHFQNAVLLFEIRFGTNGNSSWVEKLQFETDVDKIKIDLTGTTASVVNDLNSKAATIFAEYRDYAQNALKEAVLPFINSYLADKTLAQLLGTLASVRQPSVLAH